MPLKRGDCAPLPDAIVAGIPRLFNLAWALSNLNLKTSFGPLTVLIHSESGKVQVGQVNVAAGVVAVVVDAPVPASLFFLHEAKSNKIKKMPGKLFILFINLIPLKILKYAIGYTARAERHG
jgi:hypothetical protein